MLLTFVLKIDIHSKFKNSLAKQNIHYNELNTTPTILNSVLWAGIAYNDSMLYTAEYSYLDKQKEISWIGYPRHQESLKEFDSPSLQTLVWFSDGNYFSATNNDTLSFYNVKWGRMNFDQTEPDNAFVFFWKFYRENGVVKHEEIRQGFNFRKSFSGLWNRLKGI